MDEGLLRGERVVGGAPTGPQGGPGPHPGAWRYQVGGRGRTRFLGIAAPRLDSEAARPQVFGGKSLLDPKGASPGYPGNR